VFATQHAFDLRPGQSEAFRDDARHGHAGVADTRSDAFDAFCGITRNRFFDERKDVEFDGLG
jgi:hypothetical protein